MYIVNSVDVPGYCTVHPNAVLPDPDNCAKFYNCSEKNGLHNECTYPDLFNPDGQICQEFLNVTCSTRKEPQVPCKFLLKIHSI